MLLKYCETKDHSHRSDTCAGLFYVVFLVKENKRKCMCYLDVLFPSVEVYL